MVTDRDGTPIGGLTTADFIVIEDGVPQEIAFLEYQRLRNPDSAPPPVPAARTPAEPGALAVPPVVSTALPSTIGADARFRDRRLLIFYFDRSALGGDVPDTLDEVGGPFGQNDAEFNLFNTNRQLAALQTAATMLDPLPERKTLVYFGSGLRLNPSENLAQLRATINAAVRAPT